MTFIHFPTSVRPYPLTFNENNRHLLGKKSWNVYNPENVARVRRDEARAKAQEEEEERRMQEVDAERRIKLLRGERPPSLSPPPRSNQQHNEAGRRADADLDNKSRYRKRRRIAGENDTDRDIRFAREDAASNEAKREELLSSHRKHARRDEHVAITDSAGHINLFTEDMTRNNKRADNKNTEAEAEKNKKKRALEDQYTMRFSNAAGFKDSVGRTPWYSSSITSSDNKQALEAMPSTDVWGNEDPMRKEREKARMDSNDPLAAMKAGVRGLKTAQRERHEWQQKRLRELEDDRGRAGKSEHNNRRRRRSHSQDSAASLERFSLDSSSSQKHAKDKDSRADARRYSHHRHRHRRRHHS